MLKRIQLECRGRSPEEVSELNLDNCRSTGEPEGLTDEFTALQSLSMVKAGLTTLKGFPDLPSLEKLDISGNRISGTLSCLKGCTSITNLNISENRLKTMDALEPLAEIPNLTTLDLSNCEVTKWPKYREMMFALIPSLQYLDGFDVNDQEVLDSEDEDEVDEEEENGEVNHSDGLDEDEDDEIDEEDDIVDGEEEEEEEEEEDEDEVEEKQANHSNVEEVPQNAKLQYGDEDGEDGDEESDAESDEEQEYDLAYLDGADIQDEDSEEDEDYEGGEEQADEEIDEEDEDAAGDAPRGVKRKHAEEEENA